MRSPLLRDVEAHGALGVGVQPAAGGEHLGPAASGGPAPTPRATTAAAPSPKSPLATRFGDRDVVALHGQRAQLDGDQHRDVVRVAEQVVVQPGDPGRAGDAAQPDERDPLDVGAQPEQGGDPGVERRDGEAGHRGRDDQVDVGGGQVGRLERVRRRARAPSSTASSMNRSLAWRRSPRGRRTRPAAAPGCAAGRRRWRGSGAAVARRARLPAITVGERVGDLLLRVAVLGQHARGRERISMCQLLHRRRVVGRLPRTTQAGGQAGRRAGA